MVVAFPSREAFVGYWLPMDQLIKGGIEVKEVFAGNQEGAMSRLQFGKVAAAAVNKKLLEKYAQREDFRYRVIWTSDPYRTPPSWPIPPGRPGWGRSAARAEISARGGAADAAELAGQLALAMEALLGAIRARCGA